MLRHLLAKETAVEEAPVSFLHHQTNGKAADDKGKEKISENLRMMILMQDVWK